MPVFDLTTAELALIVSTAAVGLSVYTLAKARNSVSVALGCDYDGDYLCLTNNSPHAVTVVDMGTVKAKGGRRSVMREDLLKRRIDPRDVTYIYFQRFDNYDYRDLHQLKGAYIELATGQRFYSRSRVVRAWAHLRAWMNIGAKRSSSPSKP
ncbi:hypothetical protein [Pseudomonas sp. NPDC096950]|uniref:hypothetical protein n=1 Tax=Pseudomonas sp. NPDC096950 TaxID=3364485 RepID=UPI00383B373E